jgi:hypothetical protein
MEHSKEPRGGYDATVRRWLTEGAVPVIRRVLCAFRWPAIVLLCAFSIGHFAGAGQKEQEVIRTKKVVAEKYEIPGADGKPLAMFYRSDGGQARLVFFNKDGGLRLSVGMNPDGAPGIALLDERSKPRISMTISNKGSSPKRVGNFVAFFQLEIYIRGFSEA